MTGPGKPRHAFRLKRWTSMNPAMDSTRGNNRKAIVRVATVLSGYAVLQGLDPEIPILLRVGIALVYFAASFALVRNWPNSRNISLLLVFVIVGAASGQLASSAMGVSVPPVPLRDYASLAIAFIVLSLAVPALIWLWRHPRDEI
jgi:hypothetical protein